MNQTKIEWTDTVWNPVTGCTKKSPGCANCYAERMAKRLAGRCGYPADEPFRVALHPERLDEPLRWKKPRRVFVCSMGDLFHDDVPTWMRFEVLDIVLQAKQHTFLILTKRPANMKEYFDWYYTKCGRTTETIKNLWLGVTAENQQAADERIPLLLQTPAAVRFVSCEPLLELVDLGQYLISSQNFFFNDVPERPNLDWVIVGGETGPNARPMHPYWVMSLRDQCQAAGVPFFLKSWGEWLPNAQEYNCSPGGNDFEQRHVLVGDVMMCRVGKKRAGRLLDGRTWDEIPITKGAV